MGTLYECLREARLEQFYPAFRANGITRSEALITLGMPEFCALGITASEDKRRLIELVNIIKSVHTSGLSESPTPQRRNAGFRQQTFSGGPSTAILDNSPGAERGGWNNSRSNRSIHEISPSSAQHSETHAAAQDRVPNFSVASYVDMLQYMSNSGDSGGDDHSEEEQAPVPTVHRSVTSPSTVRASSTRGPFVERVKHTKVKGYNYGVHKVATPTKTRTSRSGSHRNVGDDKIKVCVRKRPIARREQRAKDEDIVLVESTNTLIVNEPKLAVDLKAYTLQHEFIFDEVFDESCSNEDVYIRAARPLISCIFQGGTATCFAYGQTGAGKTHTMLGNENTSGLYLLAGQDIFSIIQSGKYGRGLHVWVSFFEIYCGQLFDLLNHRNRLHAREDGSRQVCIAGLTETEATSVNSLVQTLEYGNSVRSKGATGVNPDSSRSHAILQLDIRDSEDMKVGKISFIDLAGSERASDVTDTDRQTRMEGAEINQSLLALKECIRSIDQESRHTPFRQSKLTHILKDSFVGNSRTCMIANVSPTQSACENTLNTLRYADRVKELKRDSVRSSSVGQAMNLLMNIPPTAPSIFHPSNILSSSTPMRVSTQSRRERTNAASEVVLDPSETPIRGHHMPRRHIGKESSRQKQTPPQTQSARSRTDQLSVVTPTPHVPPGTSMRSSAHATAASQGASAPPPDASPSESDHTDTDSCNVTHPTFTKAGGPPGRQLPIVKSTDTEFDFPTSDFNNVEDFNDLNRADTRKKEEPNFSQSESQHPSRRLPENPPQSAAASAEPVASSFSSSNRRQPVVKPVVYRSTDPDAEMASAPSPTISGAMQKFQASDITSPQLSKHPPSFKKEVVSKLMVSSDESIDDEDLFPEGSPCKETPQASNDLAGPSSKSSSAMPDSKANPASYRQLMLPLPADSHDLTKFTQSQRPSLRQPEPQSASTTNDLSAKPSKPTIPQQYHGAATQSNDLSQRGSSSSTHARVKSPSRTAKSAVPKQSNIQAEKPLQEKDSNDQSTTYQSQLQQQQQSVHQLAKNTRKSPPVTDFPHSVPSPPAHSRAESIRSPLTMLREDVAHNSESRRNSDESDSKRHRRSSNSPTGEVSDDSTDSLRASLSDQGQGGYRHHREGSKPAMRKERGDPMLALIMQRKKQTLPDPQNFSKMLTRSNTPKAGLAHRDAGWKVTHNELSPKTGTGEEAFAAGDTHSEPSSLNPTGLGSQEDIHTEQQEHFSDSSNYSGMKTRESNRQRAASRANRSKQLPQVPPPELDPENRDTSEVVIHQDIPTNLPISSTGVLDLPVKINSAVVTEKLHSGAVFSPIHPQPVTIAGTKSVAGPSTASSLLLQPTPVTASSVQSWGGASSQDEAAAAVQEVKMHLVSAHEDQLATITSLCRYEMRLLLNAKKVSGRKGFDDYLRRVSDILQQKMSAIASLHEQISHYRSNNSQSSSMVSSVVSSVAVSDAGSQVSTHSNPSQK